MRRLLLFCVCLMIAAPVAADEILLTNGDRFTGTVVSMTGNTLTVNTRYGPVRIGWADVASLVVTDPILVITMTGTAPAEVRIAAGDAPGRVALDPGGPIELAQIIGLARPQPAITYTGGASAGLISTSGNTEVSSLRIDGDITVRAEENRYNAALAINRAEDRDVETARKWTAALNYDRFLNERLFVNGNAIFLNDRFRDIALRTALGAGIGYQVLDTALLKLMVKAGLGWVNQNFDVAEDDSYTAARESATLDVPLVPDRVLLFHNHDGYYGLGDDNLFFRMSNGARVSLLGGLVTTMQIDFDYDRLPSPGRKNTDRTFALTFGYRF